MLSITDESKSWIDFRLDWIFHDAFARFFLGVPIVTLWLRRVKETGSGQEGSLGVKSR